MLTALTTRVLTPRFRALFSLFPFIVFGCMLIWSWRVYDLARYLPSPEEYGDPFEVLWMIDRFYNAFVGGSFPNIAPEIWHPVGLRIGALGYTPATFLIMMPFRAVSNAIFAYNVSTLLGLAVCYACMYRLARRFAGIFAATVATVLFTFTPFMNERVLNGHANILWGIAVLPWFVLSLLNFVSASDERARWRAAVWSGVAWGVLITFQLYGIWWGGLCWLFALMGLRQWRRMWPALAIPAIALLIASPTLIYFALSSRSAQIVTDALPALVGWGASLNSLFIPSIFHPLAPIREFATSIYGGIQNESGISNLGTLLGIVGLVGIVLVWRQMRTKTEVLTIQRNEWRMLLLAAGVSLVLSLGLAVKWDGHAVQVPIFASIDQLIWQLGHALKPALFVTEQPVQELANSIPTPGYLFAALLPTWESARVYARFSFVVVLVLALLAAVVLRQLKPGWQLALAALLIIEVLPVPTYVRTVPTQAHPALDWIAAQTGTPAMAADGTWNWNILDIGNEPNVVPILLGGKVIYAARMHNLAVSSGFGSYPLRHIVELRAHLLKAPEWTQDMRTPFFMHAIKIRYVLVHQVIGDQAGRTDKRVWDGLRNSPYFKPVGCFEPYSGGGMWPHEICVAEALWREEDTIDMIPTYEWSPEAWGIWAMAKQTHANWIGTRAGPYQLKLQVFPSCSTGQTQTQTLSIKVNQIQIGTHTWLDCQDATLTFDIPASASRLGWNDIDFEFGYVHRVDGDTRPLAAGFSLIKFVPQ